MNLRYSLGVRKWAFLLSVFFSLGLESIAISANLPCTNTLSKLIAAQDSSSAHSSTPEHHTRVYRAVSLEEYHDIFEVSGGQLRPGGRTSMEGKWFADTLESAIRHGTALHGAGNFRIIEVDIPDDAPSLYRHHNIDRLGAGRYLDQSDLPSLSPRPIDH